MELKILPMTPDSAVQAAALERECFSAPWREADFNEMLARPDAVFFCAFADAVFAGPADMLCVLDEGQICNIAVSPAFRRRGVGRALIAALIEEASRRALSVMMLEVRASNMAAQALYEASGFEKVGVRRAFYASPREDAYLYNRYLK